MKLDIHKTDGISSGKAATLPKEVFEIEPNDHLIYLAIRSQQKIAGRETLLQKPALL